MNSSGGSFIKRADGSLLRVEGPEMRDEDRAAASKEAAEIIADAERKAKADADAAEKTKTKADAAAAEKPAAAQDAPNTESGGGSPGRNRPNPNMAKE